MKTICPFCCDTMAVRSISSLIGKGFKFSGCKCTILANPGNNVGTNSMTRAIAIKCFFTGKIQFYQMASDLQAKPGAQWFIKNILFVSKTAADIRFNDMNLSPIHSKCLTDSPTNNMRNLCGRYDCKPSVFHFCCADKIFNMTVLDYGCIVPAFYLDKTVFFYRFFIIALIALCVLQNIIRIVLMDLRCPVLHSFLYIQDKWIFFIFNFDFSYSLRSRNIILSNNRCNIIAIKSNFIRQYQSVCHVLM